MRNLLASAKDLFPMVGKDRSIRIGIWAYVLYSPPLTPPAEFDVIDTIALDQPEGWALVDLALKIVGVERMGASALVKEIIDELPPAELEGG